jgi:hypothetical protein
LGYREITIGKGNEPQKDFQQFLNPYLEIATTIIKKVLRGETMPSTNRDPLTRRNELQLQKSELLENTIKGQKSHHFTFNHTIINQIVAKKIFITKLF